MSADRPNLPAKMPPQPDAGAVTFDVSLAAAFQQVARAFPTRVALDSGAHRFTYRDVDDAANCLAHRLIEGGGAPADRVAILMAHDAPAIAAVVGVLKAGRIVVALSPGDPLSRIGALIEDAEPSVIVTDAENSQLASGIVKPGCEVLTFAMQPADRPAQDPSIATDPGRTAALVYTSGATGRPKGVMKTHRQICRNVAAHTEAMQYSETDRIPLFSSIGTGQGMTVVWCALLNGATLCPFAVKSKGLTGLADWISDIGLTVYVSSASIFRALVRTLDSQRIFSNVRALRLASESVTSDDVKSFRAYFPPDSMFVHTLSSSETGNIAWSRFGKDDDVPDGRIPVGRVSRDIEVLLLGDDGEPVPPGEMGEVAVRSRYAAAGYWRDPVLTAERFSPDLDGHGTRLVRNGDWARINAGGQIEFCGRKDDRIKIRGNRIELSDVELALARLPGIERAAAVAIPRDKQESLLVAFVVMNAGATWTASRLRHAVAANLPLHMLPSRFVFVDRIPLGAGGKIDREALRACRLPSREGEPGEPPRSRTEILLADIWAEALDLPEIWRDDDFFSLGGDSLRGAIVAAEVHSSFGIEIGLAAIAEHPTISALAAFIDTGGRRRAARDTPIVPVSRNGPMPLSPFQERVWQASEIRPGAALLARSYHISGPVDVEALEECFRYLVDRHEILRTTFDVVEGRPAQIVHPSAPLGFSFVDVSKEADPRGRAEAVCLGEAGRKIDRTMLPISRLLLIRIAEEEHWLLRTGDALIQDGASFAILMDEFAALYEAKVKGMAPPIPRHMLLQYADYAVWHREIMRRDGAAYREMLAWWKQVFSRRLRTTRLPFGRSVPAAGVDPGQGVIRWQLDAESARRLDMLAREAGATHYSVRLACFVALVADMTARSTVIIGANFANRQRIETGSIVGLFSNLAPLVIDYRPGLKWRDWVEAVRDRLFETEANAELPFEDLYRQLREAGLKTPSLKVLFTMSSDWSQQRVGGMTISRRPHPIAETRWGCQIYIDQRTPENCRVEFDAGLYPRAGMQAMVDRYLRLLEAAARQPGLSIGRLVAMSSGNPLRRACANCLTAAGRLLTGLGRSGGER